MAGKSSPIGFIKKLKLLDYLIIILVLLAAVIFYKFVHHKQKWINVTALAYSNVFLANSMQPQDYEVDSSGKKIALVRSFETVDTPALNGNQFVNKLLIMNISMLVDTNSRSTVLQYKNQPLAVGSQIDLNFNSAKIQAYISEIEGSIPKKMEERILTVIIYNQWPWFADSINIGDSQTDTSGKKIIEVISKEVRPTQVVNVVSPGEVVDYTGSTKVDITLKLKTQVEKINDKYIFRGYNNIFVGKAIPFTLGNVQINSAAITNIE